MNGTYSFYEFMQLQWWGNHKVVGTLKPCHIPKNLFELLHVALTGGGDTKTSSASTHTISRTQEPRATIVELLRHKIFLCLSN